MTITSCLKKAAGVLSPGDAEMVKAVYQDHVANGMKGDDAARQAVQDVMTEAIGERDQIASKVEGLGGFVEPHPSQVLDALDQEVSTVLEQTARGFIQFTEARDIFKVTLTGKANLSTFLHESGHYWLEVMQDIAEQEGAPEQLADDLLAIRKWAGVPAGERFSVKHHEKWAQGFEKYLMEGRAPSNALQQAFGRFKAWLSFIYRKVGLDVELTDEVRGVMDRLIADDQAISEARTQVGIPDQPMTQEELSLTHIEYTRYTEAWMKAREAEKAELDRKAMADYQAEQKAAWRDGIAKHAEDLTAQLQETKGYEALVKLEERELKLDKNSIPQELRSMARGLTSERGIDLDSYATSSGWASGHEMLTAIAEARAGASNIASKARQMMIEEHGHLTPTKLADEALKAVHGDDQVEVSLVEFRALAEKAGIKVVPGLARWMRRQAEEKVGALTKRQLGPGKWRRAEIKAATESARAAAKGDIGEAALAKRRQMMSGAMLRATVEAQESVTSIRRYLLPFTTNKRRSTVGKAGEIYLDAFDELLEGVSLKQITGKAARRLNTLNDLIAHAAENEEALNIPPDLADEARRKNFADMTMDELHGLKDAVTNIWHLARLKNKLRDGKMKRDMDQAMEEAARTADAAMKTPEIKEKFTRSKIDNGVAKLKTFRAFLTKTEFMLSWLDGKSSGGLLHRTLYQPFVDAGHEAYLLHKQFKENLIDKMRDMPRDQKARWEAKRTFLGKEADGATIIAAALNLGTELNKERLVNGEQVTEQQMRAEIDAFMTKEDWEMVQLIWDQTNSLWPHVEKMAQQATGLKPPKQESLPVDTPFGEFRGGYYPIAYDPERSDLGSRIEGKTDAMFGNNFASNPVLANGFTKARRDQVPSGNPLKLDLGILSNHLAEVVHYVTHYEAVDQANRMLKNRQFKQIVTNHLGDDYHKSMKRWLQDIARNQDTPHDTKYEPVGRAMKYLRGGTSIATMGYNMFTAMKQHLGLTTALDALPAKYLLHGIRRAYLDPLAMQTSAYKEAMSKSKELPSLIREFDRDDKMVTDAYRRKTAGKLIDKVVENAFVPMGYMQAMVNTAVWIGAHAQSVDQGATDSQAVNVADAIVRQTQGTGKIKDLAGVQRGSEINRMMSMFYSWMSVMFNRMDDMNRQQKREGLKNIPNLARRITVAFMMTTLLEEAGRRGWDEITGAEDEDEAGYLLTVLLKTGDLAVGTIPFVRTFLSFEGAYRKQLTPVGGAVEDIDRGSKALVDLAIEGEVPSRAESKAIARGLSAATRKPAYGIYRMFDEFLGEDVFGDKR